MKRSSFTEDPIIGISTEHEAGISAADLCRKHGVSDATVYKWKAKFDWLIRPVFTNGQNSRIIAHYAACTKRRIP